MWKGGKMLDGKGYILIYCPEHPHAVNKYVPEHRLIIERALGRYLTKEEFVHHRNGIKDDNTLENLQIVTSILHYGEVECPKCKFKFLIR